MATGETGGSGGQTGITRILKSADGAFKVDLPRGQVAQIQVVDLDLVLVLRDGTRVVLPNAAIDAMDARPPVIVFADGASIATPEAISEAGKVQKIKYSQSPVSTADQAKKSGGAGEGETDRDAPKAPVPKAPSDAMVQQATVAMKSAGQYAEPPVPVAPQTPAQREASPFQMPPARSAPPTPPTSPPVVQATQSPPKPAEPPEQPPSPTPTDGVPAMSLKLVSVSGQLRVARAGGGSTIRGAGGDEIAATDPSPRAQAAPEIIVGTALADLIFGDAQAAPKGQFAKVLAIELGGLREVRTVTIRGLPEQFVVEGAVRQPDGSWKFTPPAGIPAST